MNSEEELEFKKTGSSSVEERVRCLEKDMVSFKTEVVDIGQKVEVLGIRLESGMKEIQGSIREMALTITSAQKDQFSQFYVRCLFAVSLTLFVVY